jgi:hypothetical protein
MYFSVGILYSAQEFLRFLRDTPKIGINIPEVLPFFNLASTKAVLEVSHNCEWVQLNLDGHLFITEKGMQVLNAPKIEVALRIQITDLVDYYRPTWLPLLSQGRSAAAKYLPVDVAQCFREAGLFTTFSDTVVAWWDRIAKIPRKIYKDEKLDVGRTGEKLSIDYERNRTKKEPFWQAIESNSAGFDILSTVSDVDPTPLNIEVKTSNSKWDVAIFYISINEWRVAETSKNYIFHLWSLLPKPRLFIVEVSMIEEYIPTNHGEGEWQSVAIPFSAVCIT